MKKRLKFKKRARRKKKKENEGFPGPGGDFIAPGKNLHRTRKRFFEKPEPEYEETSASLDQMRRTTSHLVKTMASLDQVSTSSHLIKSRTILFRVSRLLSSSVDLSAILFHAINFTSTIFIFGKRQT
jgi:hypothetical protein